MGNDKGGNVPVKNNDKEKFRNEESQNVIL
jgi:hypothetical protein